MWRPASWAMPCRWDYQHDTLPFKPMAHPVNAITVVHGTYVERMWHTFLHTHNNRYNPRHVRGCQSALACSCTFAVVMAPSVSSNVLQYGYIFQWEPSEYDPDEWDHAYKKNGTTFYTGQVRLVSHAAPMRICLPAVHLPLFGHRLKTRCSE